MITAYAALLLSSAPPKPEGVVLVFSPEVPMHLALVEALEQRDASVVAVPLDSRWPREAPPRLAIALGPHADAVVERNWPAIPRARLLLWTWPEALSVSELVSLVHPSNTCTADALSKRDGGWVVVAPEDDFDATTLAAVLGAPLASGSPAEQLAQLRKTDARNVWVRSDPNSANETWLRRLGGLARSGERHVASDLPGLTSLGIAQTVAIDLDAIAETTTAWLHTQRRYRRRRPKRTLWEAPCQTL